MKHLVFCLFLMFTIRAWSGASGFPIAPPGTSGSPSSVEVTNFPSTYPVTGTFWQAIQPVSQSGSWTISNTAFTANAGTNLNTSALNLEATQSAMSAKFPATLGQKTMDNSFAVVLASDQGPVPTNATVTPSVASYTDCSTTITTGGTSQTLIASNSARKEYLICNISTQTESAWVNFTSAASTSVNGSIEILPGQCFSSGPVVSGEQINATATTTGHAVVCKYK